MLEKFSLSDIDNVEILPLIALRGITVFPEMVMSFDVERRQSVSALNASIEGDRRIFLSAQKEFSRLSQ